MNLLAIVMPNSELLLWVFAGFAAFFGAKLAFQKKTGIEDEQLALIHNAGVLRQNGLSLTPDLVERLAIGDGSRALRDFKIVARVLKGNPELMQKEFDNVLKHVVDKRISEPAVQAYLKDKITTAEASAKASAQAILNNVAAQVIQAAPIAAAAVLAPKI